MHKGERFNSISHLAGAVLAIAGTAALIVLAAIQGDGWKIISFSIYGATLVLLYLFSTLYHGIRRGKTVLRKLDHGAIYLLIAGSYTPFTLVTLRGPLGWTIFGVVWGLAALGIVIDLLLADRRRILPVVIYLLMGWLAVFALKPLLRALPLNGFCLVAAGRRTAVYGRNRILCARRETPHEPRHLAPVRARGEHRAVHRGLLLCAVGNAPGRAFSPDAAPFPFRRSFPPRAGNIAPCRMKSRNTLTARGE